MSSQKIKPSHLQIWLALLYIGFIAYASLSPFTGWKDVGITFTEVLKQDPLNTYTLFDAVANCLAYMPIGFLLVFIFRYYTRLTLSAILSAVCCLMLSSSMEYSQMYLPSRVSSNMDLITNTSGGLLGALLALPIIYMPWLSQALSNWRKELFQHGAASEAGLALLVLWIFTQSNPSLPMLGNVFITPLSASVPSQLPSNSLHGWAIIAVTLNLLMLGSLLRSLLRNQHLLFNSLIVVLVLVSMIKFLTAAALLKSWALLLWMSSEAILGMLLGLFVLVFTLLLPKRFNASWGALVIVAYLLISSFVLSDNEPSNSMSIYHWHYLHLLNYNGLAKSLMLLFPILLLAHLWRTRKL